MKSAGISMVILLYLNSDEIYMIVLLGPELTNGVNYTTVASGVTASIEIAGGGWWNP
jgi:hypothetical protein